MQSVLWRIVVLVLETAVVSATTQRASIGLAASGFQTWLHHLEFSAPSLNLGTPPSLHFAGGSCTALSIGGASMRDSSAGPNLKFALNISGVDIKCTLRGSIEGLSADVALRNSWVATSLAVMGDYLEGKPLPLQLMMGECKTGLHASRLHFTGSHGFASSLNADTGNAFRHLTESITSLLCGQIPQMVNTFGNNMLTFVAGMMYQYGVHPQQLSPLPQARAPLMDWGSYPPVLLGKEMIAERFAKWQSGQAGGDVLNVDVAQRFAIAKGFRLRIGTVQLAGLSTILAPGLLLDGHNGTIDAVSSARRLALKVALEFEVAPLQEHVPALVQNLNLTVGLRDLSVTAQALAMLSKKRFDALGVSQMLMPGCILDCAERAASPASEALGVRQLSLNMTDLSLLTGVSGSLEQDLAVLVDSTLGSFLQGYLPSLLPTASALAMAFLDSRMTKLWTHLNSSAFPCKGVEGTEFVIGHGALRGLWATSVALMMAGVAASVVALFVKCSKSGRRTGQGSGNEATQASAQGAERFHDQDVEAGSSTASPSVSGVDGKDFCLAATVPRPLAVAFPFAVLAVLFLFLFADLGVGTSVGLLIRAGNDSVAFGPLFSFSLIGTIQSTWEAEAYAISVLTLLFSGVWPLLKLGLLMVAWLAPPRQIGMRTRGRLLSFLDVWGKYSFLDSWFLVLCMSAFTMDWHGGNTSLEVRTRPTAAYFVFLLATVLSLLLGNVASRCHLTAEGKASPQDAAIADDSGRRVALGRQGRSLPTQLAIAALLLASVVLTVAGAFVTSFQFGMSGLGADLLFEEARHTEDFGLIGVGSAVTAGEHSNAGLVALQAIFLTISFVVPLLLLLALSLLWLVPLRAEQQSTLLYWCHVLDSWSALDVFVLTVLVGHSEFSRLAGRLLARGNLKAACVPLEENFGIHCMDLDLSLLPGFVLLAAAGIVALVVPKTVQQLCRRAAEARDVKAERRSPATEADAVEAMAVQGSPAQGVHANNAVNNHYQL
mmetsp:Transcript_56690/g.175795  ORF Transcript_56690/g.175795 Transcript_56690/m.175795 type:complete len:1000 (-) Transcript_56690:185-3184(-)